MISDETYTRLDASGCRVEILTVEPSKGHVLSHCNSKELIEIRAVAG